MAKSSSVFICQNCAYESPKWLGQCPSCGSWNTFEETLSAPKAGKGSAQAARNVSSGEVVRFSQVKDYDHQFQRLSSGMEEFDRVLGGGIVFGSVVLIGGEPGIGKSTLLTHLTLNILNNQSKQRSEKTGENEQIAQKVLYAAGEESPEQIGLRIQRMEKLDRKNQTFGDDWKDNLLFMTSTDVDEIIATIENEKPDLAIIDSIQTLSTLDLSGSTGSIGQLKECTDRLTRTAKRLHIPIFLVGHVTKEGTIAGPKVLEHIVDSVLELSGERTGQYRILRAIKNRFGETSEVGIFEHCDEGLREVTNPSEAFLEERLEGSAGSAIVSVMEGTRPILIEVQALVIRTQLAIPRRVARGIPVPKLQVLCAVLEKYANIPLSQCDVFVNVAGGFTITEPAVDLGIAIALASSYSNTPVMKGTVYVGEVGLLGEVRKVKFLDRRVKEAKRIGFSKLIGPNDIRTLREAMKNFSQKGREG